MAEKLPELLEQYEFTTLQAIASYNGYKAQGRVNKGELIQLLQTLCTDPARIKPILPKLTPAEREVLIALQRQGGSGSRGAISRRLRDLKLLDAQETRLDAYSNQQPDYRRTDSRYLDEILAHLLALGLVFGLRSPDPWGRTTNLTFRITLEYVIPAVILAMLPPPPELPAKLPTQPAPAKILESSARTFQRDLYLYWSYIDRNHPELIGKGVLAKRHLTAVNDTLLQREKITTGKGEADFPRLYFIRHLLIQLGLIEMKDLALKSRPAEKFFELDPQERIRRTYEAYITGRAFNELTQQNAITPYGERLIPVPDRLVDARRTVALYFRLASGWTTLEALTGRIRDTQYEFFLPRTFRSTNPQSYYYSLVHPYSQSGNPLGWEWQFAPSMDEGEGWRRVEGAFIAWMVNAPMYWMGLVDLGMGDGAPSEPDRFQLTTLGRWLLAGGPGPEIPVGGGQVIVQPDFTILAFDPISDNVLYQLEQFAKRLSAERTIHFRLTQQSVYAGQQAGWDVARILAYLEKLTHLPLPANVARTLTEWQAVHERIRIYPHVNVLHADAADLEELAVQPKAQKILERRLESRVVVLPAGKKLDSLRSQLIELGWWPVVTPRAAGLPPNSVATDEEGRLTCLQRNPGLYLRAHLARFAESDAQNYRLTPASIRRAVNAGLDAPQIVNELNRVLNHPVSAALGQRLLAWSGHFGQVQAEEMTVLRFKSDTALRELQRNANLTDLLRALKPDDFERVALVRRKDVEKLRRLLEERGVEWKEG